MPIHPIQPYSTFARKRCRPPPQPGSNGRNTAAMLDTATSEVSLRPSSSDAPISTPLGKRVSIILLTYNCAHRLERILDETLAAGVPVIAVDNGSRDGTVDILAARKGISLVRLPRNIGAAARNVGAEAATTPYIAFCDDDGWYERDGLELACDLLDEHPTCGLINARIFVGPQEDLDPISAEMA